MPYLPVDIDTLCQPADHHESELNASIKLQQEATVDDILNCGLQTGANPEFPMANVTPATQISYNETDHSHRTSNAYEDAVTESIEEGTTDNYDGILNNVLAENTCQVECIRLHDPDNVATALVRNDKGTNVAQANLSCFTETYKPAVEILTPAGCDEASCCPSIAEVFDEHIVVSDRATQGDISYSPVDNDTLREANYHESADAKLNADCKLQEEATVNDILNGGLQKQDSANPQFLSKTATTQHSYNAADFSDRTTSRYENTVTVSTDERAADDYDDTLNNVLAEKTSECCQVECTRLDSSNNEVAIMNSSAKYIADNSTRELVTEGNSRENYEQSCTPVVHKTTPWSSAEGTRAPSFSNVTIEDTQVPPSVTSCNNSDVLQIQKPKLKRRSSDHVWINIPCDSYGIPSIVNDSDANIQQSTTNSDEVKLQRNPSYGMISDKHTTASHDETVKLRRKPAAHGHLYEIVPFKRRPVTSINGGTSKAVKGHVYEVIPYRRSRCASASIGSSAGKPAKMPSNTKNLKHRSVNFLN